MPPSKSAILPSEGGITPIWALACGKYGIQGAFGALDDVFGGAFGAHEGASEADRGARSSGGSSYEATEAGPHLSF